MRVIFETVLLQPAVAGEGQRVGWSFTADAARRGPPVSRRTFAGDVPQEIGIGGATESELDAQIGAPILAVVHWGLGTYRLTAISPWPQQSHPSLQRPFAYQEDAPVLDNQLPDKSFGNLFLGPLVLIPLPRPSSDLEDVL